MDCLESKRTKALRGIESHFEGLEIEFKLGKLPWYAETFIKDETPKKLKRVVDELLDVFNKEPDIVFKQQCRTSIMFKRGENVFGVWIFTDPDLVKCGYPVNPGATRRQFSDQWRTILRELKKQ
jgi:hypothetical protein